MIGYDTHLGRIEISEKYIMNLVGKTASQCFGVADMNPCGFRQDVRKRLHKNKGNTDGVFIKQVDDKLNIELHISVTLGTNLSAVSESLARKIRYTVTDSTGIGVSKVNVFIDEVRK